MKFSSSDLAIITGGSLSGPGGLNVKEIVTDSRQVSYAEEMAFVAIRGVNHDGQIGRASCRERV